MDIKEEENVDKIKNRAGTRIVNCGDSVKKERKSHLRFTPESKDLRREPAGQDDSGVEYPASARVSTREKPSCIAELELTATFQSLRFAALGVGAKQNEHSDPRNSLRKAKDKR
jgi:hypothetical protein